jgi:tRNA dimethylallyltransferase
LAGIDPETARRLHPNDAVRIIRAMEVFHATGVPISEHQRRDRERAVRRPARRFGLTLPRQALYDRIDRRVDEMLSAGLEEEVRRLLGAGYSPELSSMRSLGYNEMTRYVLGQLPWPEAVSAIKQSTRRYAKRQQTWFRGDPEIEWIDVSVRDSATVASRLQGRLDSERQDPDWG